MMMKNKLRLLFVMAITPVMLAGCSGAKETLGLTRSSPDEFAVVRRAPLALPPSYGLRPPAPGAPRPQEQSTNEQARQTVFGEDATLAEQGTTSQATNSEALLLQRAGGDHADPAIRNKVDAETRELSTRNQPVVKKLLGSIGKGNGASATIVNATKETERLRKNIEEGKPVTEGETPYIEE